MTDAVLAVIALVSVVYLRLIPRKNRWKTTLWVWFYFLLAMASLLGAIAHGLKMSEAFQTLLWHPLNLSLGLLIAIFSVAAVHDFLGEVTARRALPVMTVVGISFFGITLVWPGSFLVFILYEAVIMLFALGGYIWLACLGKLEGAWLMVAGIFVTMIAAGVQAGNAISFTFIWSFDHNGVYHLVQMVGIVMIMAGVRKELLSHV